MRKSTKIVALVAALVALCAMSAFAGSWKQEGEDWFYLDKDGNVTYGEWAKSGSSYYYLDDGTGAMVKDQLIDGVDTYYCGPDGARVINSWVKVAIEESEDGYEWMYFGSTGKAVKASTAVKLLPTSAGKFKFAFDENGYMVYGYTDSAFASVDNVWDAVYYFGDKEDGALKTNYWVEYTEGDFAGHEDQDSVWFFFKSNGQLVKDTTAKYNGKTYTFAADGAMVNGWTSDTPTTASYFDGGIQQKKMWIYTDKFYDSNDEDYKWYWIDNSTKKPVSNGIYKIPKDGKFYAFNEKGEMVSGLIAVENADALDPRQADMSTAKQPKSAVAASWKDYKAIARTMKLYFFSGDYVNDGSMKTGTQTVSVYDEDKTLVFDKHGVALQGYKNKKIYDCGELQAAGSDKIAVKQLIGSDDTEIVDGYYLVNASGAILKSYMGTNADGIYFVAKEGKIYKFADKDYAAKAAKAVKAGETSFTVKEDGTTYTYNVVLGTETDGVIAVNWTR